MDDFEERLKWYCDRESRRRDGAVSAAVQSVTNRSAFIKNVAVPAISCSRSSCARPLGTAGGISLHPSLLHSRCSAI